MLKLPRASPWAELVRPYGATPPALQRVPHYPRKMRRPPRFPVSLRLPLSTSSLHLVRQSLLMEYFLHDLDPGTCSLSLHLSLIAALRATTLRSVMVFPRHCPGASDLEASGQLRKEVTPALFGRRMASVITVSTWKGETSEAKVLPRGSTTAGIGRPRCCGLGGPRSDPGQPAATPSASRRDPVPC